MKLQPRPAVMLTVLILTGIILAACGGASPVEIERTPAPLATATATHATTPAPSPTRTPMPAPTVPVSTPTHPPTPTPVPTATADHAAIGDPCPATLPVKPDYARYILSSEPWPTPDPDMPTPPLSLADPLPGAGRNMGYPYGSDGSGRYLLHNGLDMADEDNTIAVAPADGTVIIARDDNDELFGWRCDWYGQLVIIQLDELWQEDPVFILFGHISGVQVREKQHVTRGDAVARKGTAGAAVVPHLHLEVRVGSNRFDATRNPVFWLEPGSGSGVIAGRLVDPEGHAWQGVTVTLVDRTGTAPFLNTWTYLDDPDHLIRPDPALGENFAFGPVAAGSYDVYTLIQGVEYRQRVEVKEGVVSTVEIVTEPYRPPTAEPPVTP